MGSYLTVCLVVDDNAEMRDLLTDMLEIEGYEVKVAKDGLYACDILEHENIDIMILDLMMPELNGHGVLLWMQEHNIKIPTIMVTAYPDQTQAAIAWDLGVDAFLMKPFNLGDFNRAVQDATTGIHNR